MPRFYTEGDKLGPHFSQELALAGITDVPLPTNFHTGEVDKRYCTPQQSQIVDEVIAAHNPTQPPPPPEELDIDSAKSIVDIKGVLKKMLGIT